MKWGFVMNLSSWMEIGQGKARTEEEQIENTADFREIQTVSRLLQNVCSSLPTT